MVKKNVIVAGIINIVMFFSTSAVEFSVENEDNQFDFDLGVYGGFVGGQIIRGFGTRGNFHHKWVQNPYFGFLLDATMNEKIEAIFNFEIYQFFSYDSPGTEIGAENKMDLFWIGNWLYLREARGIFTLGDPERFAFEINGGKWHHKYNPEVRNLGEYLFRASPYPTYYITKFDDPTYPLLGLMLTSKLNTDVFKPKLDLMLTSETAKYPMQDWSLSGILTMNFSGGYGDFLGLGAGICFDRLFPKDPNFTTPTKWQAGSENVYDADTLFDTLKDDQGNPIIDPGTGLPFVEQIPHNEKHYTFGGTKAAFRLTFDPKGFFPWDNIFGEEDLKIYAELGILGFKNYPDIENPEDTSDYFSSYYAFRKYRMPFMVGFHFPAFKILDVFAIELEWFDNPYILGYEAAIKQGWPKPVDRDVNHTKFYYTFYAKKTLGPFKFIAQVARDHMRPVVLNFNYTEWNDVLVESKESSKDDKPHWWWGAKIEFGI